MHTKTVTRTLVWVMVVGFAVSSTGCSFWDALQKPAVPTPETVPPQESLEADALNVPAPLVPEPSAAPQTSEQTVVCGETSAWNMLILGSDRDALRGKRGSDLTRMAKVDFPNKKVTIYAFPRELWVNTSGLGINYPTVEATELGTVYDEAFRRFASANRRDVMMAATNMVAKMMLWNFTLRTDHYITIELNQLPAMVDAVGGIPIYIPERTTDPHIGMVFEAGQQTLNGAQVVAYVRALPDSDFGRINRQNLLLDAARLKLQQPDVWGKIPQLYTQFNQVIATDLNLEQINHLSCLLNEVPKEAIMYEGVRQEWTSPGPGSSYLWDKNSVLNQLMGLGLIP